jgi:hypothetical protein
MLSQTINRIIRVVSRLCLTTRFGDLTGPRCIECCIFVCSPSRKCACYNQVAPATTERCQTIRTSCYRCIHWSVAVNGFSPNQSDETDCSFSDTQKLHQAAARPEAHSAMWKAMYAKDSVRNRGVFIFHICLQYPKTFATIFGLDLCHYFPLQRPVVWMTATKPCIIRTKPYEQPVWLTLLWVFEDQVGVILLNATHQVDNAACP